MSGAAGRPGFHLLDLAALIVGFGLASMLVRAYWPVSESAGVAAAVVIGVVFLWLGLAMSGPVVLLLRRPPTPTPTPTPPRDADAPRTWAELAWMIVGFYWIGLTILVVPARIQGTRFLDSAVLGVFPVLAAAGLWFVAPPRSRPLEQEASWTHRAAIALLLTWPFVWMALILLGKSLP